MSYIKQNVQGSYDVLANRGKNYLMKLKEFLNSSGFTFVEEDYSIQEGEYIVFKLDNTIYTFTTTSNNMSRFPLKIEISKNNGTKQSMIETITLAGLEGKSDVGGTTYALGSTVLFVKNQNSFALVITSSANNITSSSNIITGNIAYKLIDDTDNDISFANNSIGTLSAIEKTQGNAVTLNVAHNRLSDDRLIYENKVSVNQSNMFVGDSGEIVGLVGAEKCKIYQTEKGKYFAFANDMAIPMGDEML